MRWATLLRAALLDVGAVLTADFVPRSGRHASRAADVLRRRGQTHGSSAALRSLPLAKVRSIALFGQQRRKIMLSCLRGGTDGDLERHTVEPARHTKSKKKKKMKCFSTIILFFCRRSVAPPLRAALLLNKPQLPPPRSGRKLAGLSSNLHS
jgi:hypothetical protein